MRTGKSLIVGFVLLAAVAATAAAYVRSMSFDSYRSALAHELRVATGRDVALSGPIELSLFPRPRFSVSGVAIANAPWGTRDALVRVDRVDADIALLPLLRGDIRLARLGLVRPDFWFETDFGGKANWVLAAPEPLPAGPGDASRRPLLSALDIGGIDVTGGRAAYRNGATGEVTLLALAAISVTGDGHSAPIEFSFRGAWRSLPLSVTGTVGPFDAMQADTGSATAVKLRLATAGAVVTADGAVGGSLAGAAVFRLAARTEALDHASRRLGLAVPFAGAASLDADVRYEPRRLSVENAMLAVGGQSLTGSVAIDFSRPRPVFDAEVLAASFEIDGFASATPADELGPLQGLASSDVVRLADGDLLLDIGAVRLGAVSLKGLKTRMELRDGVLSAGTVTADSAAGALRGGFRLDSGETPPVLSMTMKAPSLTVGPWLQGVGSVRAFGGVAYAVLNASTVLGTPETMLAALEGDALFAMGEGALTLEPHRRPDDPAEAGIGDLAGLLAARDRQSVAIECAASRLAVADGVARSDGFVIISADSRVKGEGTIDLTSGELFWRLKPEPRNGPLRVGRPVAVGGVLGRPIVSMEEGGGSGWSDTALFPIRDFFSGLAKSSAANACLRSLPPVPKKKQRRFRSRPIAQQPAMSALPPRELPRPGAVPPEDSGGQAE